MARIAGINLPNDKRTVIGLTYIYGIGPTKATAIVQQAQVSGSKRIKDLSEEEVNKLRQVVEKDHTVEGDLRREMLMNIKRLKEINAYRGSRHVKKLPARGQRSKTNSRTVRGNVRRTMGSGRRAAAQKT